MGSFKRHSVGEKGAGSAGGAARGPPTAASSLQVCVELVHSAAPFYQDLDPSHVCLALSLFLEFSYY